MFFSVVLCSCDIEWYALETNRDHSVVFEIASKYCISDSFVDHDSYSISSEGFLPTEALYSQQKQDQELTVAQIMKSLLPKSDLN